MSEKPDNGRWIKTMIVSELRAWADRIESGNGAELSLETDEERHPRTNRVTEERLAIVLRWPKGRRGSER